MNLERVYKYELLFGDDWASITMPAGAVPLCVQSQRGRACLWARVMVGESPVVHYFRVARTGEDLGDNIGRYIGSLHLDDGALVLHIFADGGTP